MKARYFFFIGLLLLGFSSCKSEFEKIRLSGEPTLMLEKANAYYDTGEYQKAQTLYELVIGSYKGKEEAEDIYFKYASTYYNLDQYILAAYYYKRFSATYSASTRREEAEFNAAYCNYLLSPRYRLEQSHTEEAIDALQQFINDYPQSDKVAQSNTLIEELRGKLEEKAFASAKLYYDMQRYEAAIRYFDNMLKDFPETSRAEEIRYLACSSAYLWASNSFYSKQKDRFTTALDRLNRFGRRYPESKHAKSVNKMIATSEDKLKSI